MHPQLKLRFLLGNEFEGVDTKDGSIFFSLSCWLIQRTSRVEASHSWSRRE